MTAWPSTTTCGGRASSWPSSRRLGRRRRRSGGRWSGSARRSPASSSGLTRPPSRSPTSRAARPRTGWGRPAARFPADAESAAAASDGDRDEDDSQPHAPAFADEADEEFYEDIAYQD